MATFRVFAAPSIARYRNDKLSWPEPGATGVKLSRSTQPAAATEAQLNICTLLVHPARSCASELVNASWPAVPPPAVVKLNVPGEVRPRYARTDCSGPTVAMTASSVPDGLLEPPHATNRHDSAPASA